MQHPETHRVTAAHGPRPAGPPDRCFYCNQPVGAEHDPDCVCRERTVVIRLTMDVTVAVPEHWTVDDIEFKYNDSSWCMDNILSVLERPHAHGACLCGSTHARFRHEATEDDDELFGWDDLTQKD